MITKENTKPNIFQMELHSVIYDKGYLQIIRVPGGWIYFCEKNDQFHGGGEGLSNGVFVPYNDQFYTEELSWEASKIKPSEQVGESINGFKLFQLDEIKAAINYYNKMYAGEETDPNLWKIIKKYLITYENSTIAFKNGNFVADDEMDCNNGLYNGNDLKYAILNYDLKENECYTEQGRNEKIELFNKIKDYMDNHQTYTPEPDLESTNEPICAEPKDEGWQLFRLKDIECAILNQDVLDGEPVDYDIKKARFKKIKNLLKLIDSVSDEKDKILS